MLNSVPDEVVEVVEEAQPYSAPLGLGSAFSDPTSRDKVIEGISVPDVSTATISTVVSSATTSKATSAPASAVGLEAFAPTAASSGAAV